MIFCSNRNYLFRVLPALIAAIVIGKVRSQPGEGVTVTNGSGVTIEALVAEALAKNPEFRFYEAEIAAAKGGRRTAGMLANPELNSSLGQKTINGTGIRNEGLAWSVSLMQPFEWPGRLALRKAIADREIELAELGSQRFRAALAARVRGLAYNLFAAQERASVSLEVANRARELREVLVQRDPAGLTPLLETRVIEATELTMQKKASEAALACRTALLELNQLRGAPPESNLSIARPRLTFPQLAPKEELVGMALTNNFEIRGRAVELAQQGFRVALTKNERFAPFSAGPMISEERAGDRERVIGVGISFPVPLWNQNSGNIESAKARRLQAETSFFVTQREVERKVLEAALTYESKVREMKKWRPDSVEHFQEAAELADRHYRLGAVPVSIYIELQKQYLEAVEALFDTQREALEAAQNLEQLSGLTLRLTSDSEGEAKR